MSVHYESDQVTLHHGDCLEVLRGLPDASVDAVVTDPPYGLEFMGKDWDSFAPEPMKKRSGWDTADSGARIGEEELGSRYGRVAFHKRRATYKCSGCGKRDGFRNAHDCGGEWQHEWVDDKPVEMLTFQAWCNLWAAECLRVLKPGGHMLAFGGTRTWHRLACAVEDAGFEVRDSLAWMYGSGFPKSLDVSKAIDKAAGAEREPDDYTGANNLNLVYGAGMGGGITLAKAPAATPDAARWQGWGTALKPAFEPIVVARKPLAGTVAQNVLAQGTGALNVDGCRIATDDRFGGGAAGTSGFASGYTGGDGWQAGSDLGRWPANVVLDESQAAELDKQSGDTPAGSYPAKRNGLGYMGGAGGTEGQAANTDAGGASRFFYVAKANADERPRVDGTAHPTVKPIDLMRWLVRLVTPPGGTVLEPFAGSGTTVEACLLEGFRCIAIEREDDYLPLILQRLNRRLDPVAAVKAAGDDAGLFDLLDEEPA